MPQPDSCLFSCKTVPLHSQVLDTTLCAVQRVQAHQDAKAVSRAAKRLARRHSHSLPPVCLAARLLLCTVAA